MAAWLSQDGANVLLTLHVQPGAKKTVVAGLYGTALKIRLAAPPVDGRANECLIAFLAQTLGVAKSRITLLSGAASREKRVRVLDVAVALVAERLSPGIA
jgi:uncharacterized protein (TIGR00251 family)